MKPAFFAVIALILIAFLGGQVQGAQYLFGVVFPYVAFAIFLWGFVSRVVQWAKSPQPFPIATTAGQGFSLPWVKQAKYDCPVTASQVIIRMALEILTFRSLFRNTKTTMYDGPKITYESSKWLWLFAIMFHYSFLVIFIRHMRFFANPVPFFVSATEYLDGILQVGLPNMYVTDAVIVGALVMLFLRRLVNTQVRYISLANDYFPLFLIFAIAVTGILMRYLLRVDVTGIRQLAVGLATFQPTIQGEIGVLFFIHLFLVCTLMAYFPFSKLMHLGGIFMSPTRNLPNASRMVRHVNPWNDPTIKPHSYAAYEDDFRKFMVDAGLPVEKELPAEKK